MNITSGYIIQLDYWRGENGLLVKFEYRSSLSRQAIQNMRSCFSEGAEVENKPRGLSTLNIQREY